MFRRFVRLLMLLVFLSGLLWVGGFAGFMASVLHQPGMESPAKAPVADVIVVLTGGADRIAAAVDLLKLGKGRKLLISGIPASVPLADVLSGVDVSEFLRECCIIAGRTADNTKENVRETQEWIRTEGASSVLLVTANYHMPRSLLLFRTGLPDTIIFPYPVSPSQMHLDLWWMNPARLRLLSGEYNKYLATLLDLRWETVHE